MKMNGRLRTGLCIIVIIFVISISISNVSLWIDEGTTAYFARISRFRDLIKYLYVYNGSEHNMPFYIILIWVWQKIFGFHEFALRALNIPFALFYINSANKLIDKIGCKKRYLALFLIHPTFIYFMNEARPYVALLAISTEMLYRCYYCDLEKKRNIIFINVLYLFGVGINMLFGFAYLIYLIPLISKLISKGRRVIIMHLKILLFFCPLYGILLIYFALGPKMIGSNNDICRHLLQTILSILGMGGIIPNKIEFIKRNYSYLYQHSFNIVLIILFSVCLIFLFCLIVKSYKITYKLLLNFLSCVVLGFVFSLIVKFNFWERHIIYVVPIIIVIMCVIAVERKNDVIFAITLLVFAISSYNIRFSHYYQKDDYKGVAQYCHDNDEYSLILLQGYSLTWNYYGIFTEGYKELTDEKIILDLAQLTHKQFAELITNNKKTIIVLSARYNNEYYTGILEQKATNKECEFNAFTIYTICDF